MVWNEEAQETLEKVKVALCNELVLFTPDFKRPFSLQMDASGVALGSVLTQRFEDEELLIAYASQKLLDHER